MARLLGRVIMLEHRMDRLSSPEAIIMARKQVSTMVPSTTHSIDKARLKVCYLYLQYLASIIEALGCRSSKTLLIVSPAIHMRS